MHERHGSLTDDPEADHSQRLLCSSEELSGKKISPLLCLLLLCLPFKKRKALTSASIHPAVQAWGCQGTDVGLVRVVNSMA